jgi:hypothetical protein
MMFIGNFVSRDSVARHFAQQRGRSDGVSILRLRVIDKGGKCRARREQGAGEASC